MFYGIEYYIPIANNSPYCVDSILSAFNEINF